MSLFYDIGGYMNIIDQLNNLGLNGRQARVYLSILQLGPASAIEIAKHSGFKHPTVYDVLDVLKERRLVTESTINGRKVFAPEDPASLLQMEEERRMMLESILPDLRDLYLGGTHRTRIHFYEGRAGVMAIRAELLNVRSKEYFYFGSVQEMLKLSSPEEEEEFVKERMRRGIWSWSIRNRMREVPFEYMKPGEHNFRHVRYFPRPMSDSVSGLYIYDDKIAIGSALKENYSIIIESRELFTLMKALWQCIWDIAEEP